MTVLRDGASAGLCGAAAESNPARRRTGTAAGRSTVRIERDNTGLLLSACVAVRDDASGKIPRAEALPETDDGSEAQIQGGQHARADGLVRFEHLRRSHS